MPFNTQRTSPSPTSRLGGGGLDYITTTTFSAASTVSVDGCFTGTYDTYRVIVKATGSTTVQAFSMRLRVSGSDAATNYNRYGYAGGTGALNINTTSATTWGVGQVLSSMAALVVADLFGPFLTEATQISANYLDAQAYGAMFAGNHTTASSYDGFTIYPSTGTITGTVTVFGYRKA